LNISIIQTIIQTLALISIAWGAYTFFQVKKWNRAEAANKFYNEFDTQKECQLAMFMIDYHSTKHTYKFKYYFAMLGKNVTVVYSSAKRKSAMTKPYAELSDEEKVIRYIVDVYIG